MENNLLTDAWLTISNRKGSSLKVSLPELFSALEQNEVTGFPSLLPHQGGPFHVFLVQLACHALETSGASEHLPEPTPAEPWRLLGEHTPDEWREMIRGIIPDYAQKYPNDEPWCLVVDDLAKPAFLQCPAADAKFAASKTFVERPDDLDLMISSKNFDIKSDMFHDAKVEDWFFALISLQTNSGFLGRGNYGIARQNGAWGQRPIFTLQSSSLPGARWGRDTRVILDCEGSDKDKLWEVCQNKEDKRLLWLDPWDGSSSYELPALHPLCIEICRRVRAMDRNGCIVFKKASSDCTRISSSHMCGNLGDPWEPIVSDSEGVRVFSSALNYANIAKIVCGEETMLQNLLLRYHKGIDSNQGLKLWCSALVKRKGKTEGYFERLIPIDAQKRLFRKDLWKAANVMLSQVELAKNRVLVAAVLRFLLCGHENGSNSFVTNCLQRVRERFEAYVDSEFFSYFWCACDGILEGEITNPHYIEPWIVFLKERVQECFQYAMNSLPCNASQSVKARALGELTLNRLIAAHFRLSKGND